MRIDRTVRWHDVLSLQLMLSRQSVSRRSEKLSTGSQNRLPPKYGYEALLVPKGCRFHGCGLLGWAMVHLAECCDGREVSNTLRVIESSLNRVTVPRCASGHAD